MWIRNLLFIGVVLGASAALRASLLPSSSVSKADGRTETHVEDAPRDILAAVDRHFTGNWAEEGVKPSEKAQELQVVRRLSLALTGSIPSLEQIRRYEARPANTRFAEWLEGTLRDRRYSDYFAERLARAFVGTEDGPFIRFRRRRFVTWLSDALIANRPYDQVVREIIDQEGLWTEHPSTNFVTVTYDPEKKGHDPERLAARTARAFLGVRIDCAQCHDHPFQPWKQRDFQGIAAFYGQVQPGFTGIYDGEGKYEVTNRKSGKPETIEPRVPFLPELWTHEGDRRAQLAGWVTHPKNPNLPRATVNRVWALLFGKALVEPVDDLPPISEQPRVLELLANDFVANGYNLRRLIRTIASSEAFQRDSAVEPDASEAQERTWAVFPLTRLRPEQVAGAIYQTSSLETIDSNSHILFRTIRYFNEMEFVKRYGDTGQDEFSGGSGTIPQRLLLMNGDLVEDRTKDSIFNAAKRIALLAPTDRKAVEVAYLAVMTRRPTPDEAKYFEAKLTGTKGDTRSGRMTDLFWALINSTEFSWNH